MNQSQTICPACGSADLLFSAKRQEHLCEDCGHRWTLLAATAGSQWPPGLEPDRLPTYLAAPLASLLAEPHPRVRLHWLVDCAEIAVRWSVAVALAEVLRAGEGALPEAIVERIRDQVERPTLGKWLGMLAALSAQPPEAALLAPGVFTLYRDCFAPAFRGEGEGGTPGTSLLVLRNHLAHGGGVRTETARELLADHEPRVFELLRTVVQATAGVEVVAIGSGSAQRLAGPKPAAIPCPPALREASDGPYLVGEPGALALLPLADFGPVRRIGSGGRLEEQPGGPAAQLYLRGDNRRLTYVPVAGDATVAYVIDVDAFRVLFRLDADARPSRSAGDAFHWQDFLREARVLQDDLVGRREELAELKGWLKNRDTRQDGVARLGWIFGGPGLGKSLLMAKVAADLGGSKPWQQGVYYHRFRAGDARNSLRAFLTGLLGALADWAPLAAPQEAADEDTPDTDQKMVEVVRKRLELVAGLEPPNPNDSPPRFLVMLDGLDEVLPYAPTLPARLRELAVPGTVWLLAGRPEPSLQQAFAAPDAETIFPDGLPPMSADDIRAMLLEGLANARHALVARDEDTAEGVRNPFIERVVACADGLPLYVHLLLEDLRDGRLSVQDEQQLPQGLVAYYDALMNRAGLSDLKRDLPLLVAVLARAEEPLDSEALALLLADAPEDAPRYRERVEHAVRGGLALLRNATTADGTDGLTLYHQSFRDYVGGRPAREGEPAIDSAPALAGTVRDAEAKLGRLARDWVELPLGNLRNHLFRCGVRYALRWQGEAGLANARGRLTDFIFLQAFTSELPSSAIRGLVTDYEGLLGRLPDGPQRQEFRLWEAFFREREHVLRRGDERWPVYKILLQLAVEHADDSPLTKAAEAWLDSGNCNWTWLRNPQRILHAVPDSCLRVLEGHTKRVKGVQVLPDGRLLSWSEDRNLRLWDGQCGAPVATLAAHTHEVRGAKLLPDGRILSWSNDSTLRIWDGQSGVLLHTLSGHTAYVEGALVLSDGSILSWSWDGCRHWDGQSGKLLQLREEFKGPVEKLPGDRVLGWSKAGNMEIWDEKSGALLGILDGHNAPKSRVQLLPSDRILCYYNDYTLEIWSGHSGELLATLSGCIDAAALSDGRILTWRYNFLDPDERISTSCRDGTMQVWDGKSGEPLFALTGHTSFVCGARALPDGRILSWSNDQTLRLWDGQNGASLATLRGHSGNVGGAQLLTDGRILSWSHDTTLRLWDGQSGESLASLRGHIDRVTGALVLPDSRILSWSLDSTLRVWGDRSGDQLHTPSEHTDVVEGALVLANDQLVSWSRDRTVRIWEGQNGARALTMAGHTGRVNGAAALPDGRLLSWSDDGTLRLWDGQRGKLLTILMGHTRRVKGALVLLEERILSWSEDQTLRLWDGQSGELLTVFAGHGNPVIGALEMPGGRILSWSLDCDLRLWETHRGTCLATLSGHGCYVLGARILPDGSILSWSCDNALRRWDGQSGKQLCTFPDFHGDWVLGALTLSDGAIVSWSGNGTLIVWQGWTKPLKGHRDAIKGALELPDGRLVSWSLDGTLRLWDWDGSQCRPHGDPIAEEELAWKDEGVLIQRTQSLQPRAVAHHSAGWSYRQTAGVATTVAGTDPLCWHWTASVRTWGLLPTGVLYATGGSEVLCLQIYRGNQPVSVEEYEEGTDRSQQ